jgi:hypothetical protein
MKFGYLFYAGAVLLIWAISWTIVYLWHRNLQMFIGSGLESPQLLEDSNT